MVEMVEAALDIHGRDKMRGSQRRYRLQRWSIP